MLTLNVSENYYDEESSTFVSSGGITKIHLEHSLRSISEWESKWKIPFLDEREKTEEQIYDYIRCMLVDPKEIEDGILRSVVSDNLNIIADYLDDSRTASTIRTPQNYGKGGRMEYITSEIVYYWMIALGIPIQMETWNLNRLMTLISIVNIKNSGDNRKMSKREAAEYRNRQNEMWRKRLNSKG